MEALDETHVKNAAGALGAYAVKWRQWLSSHLPIRKLPETDAACNAQNSQARKVGVRYGRDSNWRLSGGLKTLLGGGKGTRTPL